MIIRRGYRAIALFVLIGVAAFAALDHMDRLPVLVLIAPGYVVQAWLFENHQALGGLGYRLTMAGVSALFWTLLILGAAAPIRYALRRTRSRA